MRIIPHLETSQEATMVETRSSPKKFTEPIASSRYTHQRACKKKKSGRGDPRKRAIFSTRSYESFDGLYLGARAEFLNSQEMLLRLLKNDLEEDRRKARERLFGSSSSSSEPSTSTAVKHESKTTTAIAAAVVD